VLIAASGAGIAGLAYGSNSEVPLLFILQNSWNAGDQGSLYPEVYRLETVGSGQHGAYLYSIRFHSHLSHVGPVSIFGYLAVPRVATIKKRAPGLVAIHGGGGRADKQRALNGARHGFVTLAIDLPGKGPGRARSRSTGPDMTVANLFYVNEPEKNYLVHAVRATERAITYLQTRPEVDDRRIGLVGVSWGGVIALLTATIDQRVKAAVDFFGAGYIDKWSVWIGYLSHMSIEDVKYFRQHLDPASYAPHCRTPVFVIGSTNDNCYWLPALTATYQLLSGDRYLLLRPNLGHRTDAVSHEAMWRWLQLQLGATENTALERRLTCRFVQSGTTLQARVAAGRKHVPARVEVARCVPIGKWFKETWHIYHASIDANDLAVATLPADETMSYGLATAYYKDGLALSTPVHAVWRLFFDHGSKLVDVPCLSPGVHMVPVGLLESRMKPSCAHAIGFQPETVTVIEGRAYEPLRQAAARTGCSLAVTGRALRVSYPPAKR
jgi:dienelactone hydrolase